MKQALYGIFAVCLNFIFIANAKALTNPTIYTAWRNEPGELGGGAKEDFDFDLNGTLQDLGPDNTSESYHVDFKNIRFAPGVVRSMVKFTFWLTADNMEIAGTRKAFDRIFLLNPNAPLDQSIGDSVEFLDPGMKLDFTDIHLQLEHNDGGGIEWDGYRLGVDAEVIRAPAPLPILGMGIAVAHARRLKKNSLVLKASLDEKRKKYLVAGQMIND